MFLNSILLNKFSPSFSAAPQSGAFILFNTFLVLYNPILDQSKTFGAAKLGINIS
jgi:hypothetical protein